MEYGDALSCTHTHMQNDTRALTHADRHTHALTKPISLSGPLTSSQAPVASCDRLTAENSWASHSAPVPQSCDSVPRGLCFRVCVHLFAKSLVAWWFKNVPVSNFNHANLCDRFDILCEYQSLWFYKHTKKICLSHCILIFKHKPLHCCFGNNDILNEQSVDMQFGAKHLISATICGNGAMFTCMKWSFYFTALHRQSAVYCSVVCDWKQVINKKSIPGSICGQWTFVIF